ncbi:MAG: hypothetical protein KJ850_03670 [Gammaproteobacteria bacterium]|nr:hypothetical protein [Gammaproteobacteria bacterium]MBU1624127.1 hypothetical protein [Gammaproteobacteria bacterium]MBU1981855.1 hypothetical protein [Gammaproteobacteria bacterium]
MKFFAFLAVVVIIYAGSLFYRAYHSENAAKEYIEAALLDIAKPWSSGRLESNASEWLREKSRLRPAEIVDMASHDYGDLVEISDLTSCNIQRGTDKYSQTMHTYAVCEVTGRFEKSTRKLTIRLIEDGDWKNGSWKINDFMAVN